MRGQSGGTIAGINARVRKLNLPDELKYEVLKAIAGNHYEAKPIPKDVVKRLQIVISEEKTAVLNLSKSGYAVYTLQGWKQKMKNLENGKSLKSEDLVNYVGNQVSLANTNHLS